MIGRFFHIVLAIAIFFSSSGFILNKHFCQNELKDVVFYLKAKSCHQSLEKEIKAHCASAKRGHSCPFHASAEKKEKDCCQNKSEYHKLDQDQLMAANDFKSFAFTFTLTSVSSLSLQKLIPADRQTIHYLNYKPPLIVCDAAPLLQTFLF